MRAAKPLVTSRARELRRRQTDAERLIWSRLKNKSLNGYKFVRQEAAGWYFLDFACREHRLAVEVDGATHSTDDERASDAFRTAVLARMGYRVIRFTNIEVYENLDGVMDTILAVLENRTEL